MNSKTIFPLKKFCVKLSFLIIEKSSYLITRQIQEAGRGDAIHQSDMSVYARCLLRSASRYAQYTHTHKNIYIYSHSL